MTCKKVASKTDQPDISVWPHSRAQAYSCSDSSEEPSQSNITSSLTVDDPDESFDSLPVNYSAFIKSENIPEQAYPHSPGHVKHSYIVYNHYASDQEMMAGNSYANPYVQSTSPMTVSSGKTGTPAQCTPTCRTTRTGTRPSSGTSRGRSPPSSWTT